jgi:ABC-type glycerol-3-phosphate transport system permease component
MAGFAFGRLDFRGRDLLFYSLIMLMFIPRAGGLMALYELMNFLGLRNSHLGLMLYFPSGISVALFVMRQNFLGVPRELEEAAIIDGAGTWRLLLDVNLPFVMGGIVVVAIWEFIYAWGEYLVTLTMLDLTSPNWRPSLSRSPSSEAGALTLPRVSSPAMGQSVLPTPWLCCR